MVALNENFAPENPALGSKNRVGNFFGRVGDCAGENRPATRNRIKENGPTLTIIVSGRPVWPSRDPIQEWGGLNLYAMVGNDPINYIDVLGLASDEDCPCWETLDYRMDGAPKDRRCKELEAEISRLLGTIKTQNSQVAVNNRVLDQLDGEANAFTQVALGDVVDAAIGVKLNNSGLAGDVINVGYSTGKASTGHGDPLSSGASALDSGLKFGSHTYSKVATKVAGKFTGPAGGAITLTELLGPPAAEEWQDFKTSRALNQANSNNLSGLGSIYSNNSQLTNAITKWEDIGCEGRCSKPD
jgi:hypothetical protein